MNGPVNTPINMDLLYKQYGEATLQLKIATGRVQQIEIQLQQILNSQQLPPPQA